MLQIQHIKKEYRTGTLVQKALDDVSLNLRDNEFVAILGPSGSGKTTLLNIIGGLDRYDSGDLIINGISTKKYKEPRLGFLPEPHDRLCLPELQPDPAPDHPCKRRAGAYHFRCFQRGAAQKSNRGT